MPTPKEDKTLYSATYMEIFWKNFLVGFARGLGGLATHLVLLLLVYLFVVYVILPKFQPLFNTFQRTQQSIENLQHPTNPFDSLFNRTPTIELDTPKQTK